MKRLILFCLILIISLSFIYANDIYFKTLSNGMRVAVLSKPASESVVLMCFVTSGSVHEGEYLGSGISHYLEHVISGGTTQKRTEAEYEDLYRSIGAYTNAFTNYETTAYHIQISPEYIDIALETLSEQLIYPAFDEMEVDREKQVILAEIIMRSTPPMSQIYQRANEVFNPNTHFRFPIIGYPRYFEQLTRDDLINYYNQRYRPHNMIFVAVGSFDNEEMMNKIETTFADVNRPPTPVVYLPAQHVPLATYKVIDEFDIESSYVMFSRPFESNKPEDYYALSMASEILFGKRNSPMNMFFVEDRQLVNYFWSYPEYNPPVNNNYLLTMFEINNAADIETTVELYFNKLKEFTGRRSITQKMLDDYIQRYEAEMYLNTDDIEEIASELGFSIMRYNVTNDSEIYLNELKKVTIEDVQRVIREHYLGNQTIFYAVPKGEKELFNTNTTGDFINTDLTKHVLNHRVTLLHKQNNETPVVRSIIFLPSGEEYETKNDAGTLEFMGDLLFTGSKRYQPIALADWLEDRSISIYIITSFNGLYIHFSCLSSDLDGLTAIIVDALTNPIFPEQEIELAKNRHYANYMRSLSRPTEVHREFRNINTIETERDRLNPEERLEIINSLTRNDIINAFRKYIVAENIIVSMVGDIDESKARNFATNISSKIPNRAVNGVREPIKYLVSGSTFTQTYNFDQVNIDLITSAPSMNERKDFITMEVIDIILGMSGRRLMNAVRGENDLAYFVSSVYIYGTDYQRFRINSQTSIDRKDELIAVLINELNRLKQGDISIEEIHATILSHQKTWQNIMTDSSLIFEALYNMALGLEYDYGDTRFIEYFEITPEDIIRVANKHFDIYDIVVSLPDENID